MQLEVWSDVVCPWCYIGKRHLEAALALFPHRDQVELRWRSFELDPTAAPSSGADGAGDYAGRLAAKYGTNRDGAQQMLDTMTARAASVGLGFHFDLARPANTFQVHQVIHLAADRACQDAVKERLLLGYFTEGADVGDREELVRLAAEAGLDPAEVRASLADQRYAPAVRADEADAAALGISGVPFFVLDRRYGVSGAQPADSLLAALEQAWAESAPLAVIGAGAGDACGPDGCPV